MTFESLNEHIIPMYEFSLNWRFTEEEYDVLPKADLKELKPFDNLGAEFLDDYLNKWEVHSDCPFKKNLFKNLDKSIIIDGSEDLLTRWLYDTEISFDKKVYLLWDCETAIVTKWRFVVKYWESLFYVGGPDDLIIFDESREWAILFFHEGDVYFGNNN